MKKIVKKVVAKKAPVKKLVKAQKGISTGGDKPTAASIKETRTKERGGPDPAINSPAYNKLFTSTAARDSANIYKNQLKKEILSKGHSNKTTKLGENLLRQYNKGQAGYDKMGYKKDKWGRSKDDKWFGFDPKTKKYTTGPNQGKTHAQVMKSKKG